MQIDNFDVSNTQETSKCDEQAVIKVVIQDPDGVSSCFESNISTLRGSGSTVCSSSVDGTLPCFALRTPVTCGSLLSTCSSSSDCVFESEGLRRCRYSLQDLNRKRELVNWSEFRRRLHSYPVEKSRFGTPQCGLPPPRPLLQCV